MSKKCKIIITLIVSFIIFAIVLFVLFIIVHYGVISPHFILYGDEKVVLALNESYQEEGYQVYYHFQPYKEQVVISDNINESKVGTYKITYRIKELNIQRSRIIQVKDKTKPMITLNGESRVYTFIGSTYHEEGATAVDNADGNLDDKIKIKNPIDMNKSGKYQVVYSVKDSSGNEAKAIRTIIVAKNPMNVKLNYDYDRFDNTAMQWWFEKSVDHQRNKGALDEKLLKKYNAFYRGEDEKVIYLTFDEGGSDTTYIKEIAALLNRYEIQGTFFLTRNYIMKESEFIRDLVANGHVVGNHTRNHLNMATLANANDVDQFVEEITSVEKAYMEVSGKPMCKIFRFPKGEESERSMKMLKDLGYRTYFWSHAYYDYGPQLSYEEAYESMINYYHNGAIYLIHPNNKGNYLALEDFIKAMLEEGYAFKTVDQIK